MRVSLLQRCRRRLRDPVEDDADVALASEALTSCGPTIPDAIAVPDGNKLAFRLDAAGVQIYACQTTATGGTAWVFQAPDADLFNRRGRLAGSHYAGPTWEALDGSTVVGARLAGVTVDPTAIPWLLLRAASHAGNGRMAKVSYIQRLSTWAGSPRPSAATPTTSARSPTSITRRLTPSTSPDTTFRDRKWRRSQRQQPFQRRS